MTEFINFIVATATHGGRVERPDGEGLVGVPGEGPYFRITLLRDGDTVTKVCYETYSCPVANGCGEMLCRVGERKKVEILATLTAQDLVALLRGVPEGKGHLPEMAMTAFQIALRDRLK
ncbi:MAG: hypothetical protein HONBIEJF_02531 [Fimbriimonadaceae bacterium]|nr:hypothetical protein [Fimbriimonadaceae bacterium]